jgi:alkylation response protein AidB-like acyl-CoA dehydrogenase
MEYEELQRMALDTGREFIEKKIAPVAAHIDENEEFPLDNIKEMGSLGLLGIPYPEDVGGAGLDYRTYAEFIREIAKVCASTAMTVISHSTLTCTPIFAFGSAAQKEQYLRPLLAGEKIGAFALTEPGSGSDMAGMQTPAIEEGGHFLLNGTKTFITNAHAAEIVVVAAKTAPQKDLMGISLFILEKGMPGFAASAKKEKKLGMRGSDTGELTFNNVKVPRDNLIGRKNFGLQILHQTLSCARMGMAALAIGISEGALAHCLRYVKQRKQFDQYLFHFQSIKNMLADMEMNINAASLLLHKAAELKDEGKGFVKEASEAKLFASETAMAVTKNAVQIFGGYGYSREFPLERFFRDAKLTEIGDGTSEIQRMIIADEIIKRGTGKK